MEDHLDELLADQEKTLESMAEENRQLFNTLGIEGEELVNVLHDKSRFSDEEWAALQRQRETLEKAIDERLQAARKSKKPTQAKPSHIQGHWIFVR
jgi:hypothetical protein